MRFFFASEKLIATLMVIHIYETCGRPLNRVIDQDVLERLVETGLNFSLDRDKKT